MSEVWRDVEGYTGLYQVSSWGRVRSLDREVINNGSPDFRKGRILRPAVAGGANNQGYFKVHLSCDGKATQVYVHRLVANAFAPKAEGHLHVNHIDGNARNNHACNLEWCTPEQNNKHAQETGLCKYARGENTGSAVLTNEEVLWIKAWIADGHRNKEIAAVFSAHPSVISNIRHNRVWRSVNL